MQLRDIELGDLVEIEKLHVQEFPLPNINNPRYIIKKAIILNDEVVGAAFVHVTTETSITLDSKLDRITRMKIILQLLKQLCQLVVSLGFEDTHVFVVPESNQHYTKILSRLGFVKAIGIPMYYQEGNQNGEIKSKSA